MANTFKGELRYSQDACQAMRDVNALEVLIGDQIGFVGGATEYGTPIRNGTRVAIGHTAVYHAMAGDGAGYLYIPTSFTGYDGDANVYSILKFDTSGTLSTSWSHGSYPGNFIRYYGGSLYMLSRSGHVSPSWGIDTIKKFSTSGTLQATWAVYDILPTWWNDPAASMKGLWVDSTGIYISVRDSNADYIHRLTLAGAFDASYASSHQMLLAPLVQTGGNVIQGTGTNLYVLDTAADTVSTISKTGSTLSDFIELIDGELYQIGGFGAIGLCVYQPDGTLLHQYGTGEGFSEQAFASVTGIVKDSGKMYVLHGEFNNNRSFVDEFSDDTFSVPLNATWAVYGTPADGTMYYVEDLAARSDGVTYVLDSVAGSPRTVHRFNSSLSFSARIGSPMGVAGGNVFRWPSRIALSRDDATLFVCDNGHYEVKKYGALTGTYLGVVSFTEGTSDDELDGFIRAFAVDVDGSFYFVDDSLKLKRFNSDGTFSIAMLYPLNDQTYHVGVDDDGNVYIPNKPSPGYIGKYNSSGTLQTSWGGGTLACISVYLEPENGIVMVHDDSTSPPTLRLYDTSGTPLAATTPYKNVSVSSYGYLYAMSLNRIYGICGGVDSYFNNPYTMLYRDGEDQTEWYAYQRGAKTSLGTPDGGVSIPALQALSPSDKYAIVAPDHIEDLRNAIEVLVPYFKNGATGNPFNWTPASADNLYFVAMGDRTAYGATGGAAYDWTRAKAAMIGTPTYDIDMGEIRECIDVLLASDLA